jgi:16S rRNA (cytosine1402-N4)-methyltransferase
MPSTPDNPAPGGHVPVMLDRVVEVLGPRPGEVFADCTAGMGGHAAAVAQHLGPEGTIVLNDCDPTHLERAALRVRSVCGSSAPRIEVVRGNFADLPRAIEDRGLRADMVLADLGFSSLQVEDPARGLSFMRDGPLDMRLDPTLATTAADLVNSLPEEELAQIIREYGEEPGARRIAGKLARERSLMPILTTGRLAEVVRSAVGPRSGGIDPATRTFQALRIAVNDELGVLSALLDAVMRGAAGTGSGACWLAAGARVAIISFHSLEDRAVKHAFAAIVARGLGVDLTGGVIRPSEDQVRANPRARSAKLRAVALTRG